MYVAKVFQSEDELAFFSNEAIINHEMKGKSCNSVARVFEIGTVKSPVSKEYFGFIIMEHCPKKDLFNYVEGKLTVGNERLCHFIFTKLLEGIFFFHHVCGISHRDIKLENVVFDANYLPKLIDIGLS